MTLEDHIEAEVQKRLRERAAAAGLSRGRPSLEVLFLLPPDFVRAYEALFNRALKEPGLEPQHTDPGGVVAKAGRKQRLSARSKRRVADGAGARAQSRRHRDFWIVRDEHALHQKSLMDRRLRRIARDIYEVLGSVSPDPR